MTPVNSYKTENYGGLTFFDVMKAPVRISGLPFFKTNGNFERLDRRRWDELNDALKMLTQCTSGAQISFKTDSKRIAIKMRGIFNHRGALPHMTENASMGVDLYVGSGRNKKFYGVFHVILKDGNLYENRLDLHTEGVAEVTLNLPLYSGVESFYIGLDEDSSIGDPSPYDYAKPVLFYGSSITQGACASRPGLQYPAVLARKFNFELIDLGFSGGARGEETVARQIASIPLKAFVYDYDHNAEDSEYLKRTHELFFKIIREAQPDLPVIMVSKADLLYGAEQTKLRRDVIYETYKNALDAGDRNVFFVDGMEIYGDDADNCTADGIHPNDIGFRHIEQAIYPALKKALGE